MVRSYEFPVGPSKFESGEKENKKKENHKLAKSKQSMANSDGERSLPSCQLRYHDCWQLQKRISEA